MSFIRFKTRIEKSIPVLSELTDLEVIAVSSNDKSDDFLISVLVSIGETNDSAIDYLSSNASELRRFMELIEGFDPYLEIFVDYKPEPNDSQQSEKYNFELLSVLAKHEIDLVVTTTLPYDD